MLQVSWNFLVTVTSGFFTADRSLWPRNERRPSPNTLSLAMLHWSGYANALVGKSRVPTDD